MEWRRGSFRNNLEIEERPVFDIFTKTEVDIATAFAANDANPNYHGRLIDVITDEHRLQGLRKVFGDAENYTEEALPKLLKAYKEAEIIEGQAEAFCRDFLKSIVAGRI